MTPLIIATYGLASFCAGITNTIAGGGSFLTFPALLWTGLDARAANITSTVALFPMQITSGYAGRQLAGGTETLSLRALTIISLLGGIVGALLLLLTPPLIFAKLVPWFILFATAIFAYGTFRKRPADDAKPHMGRRGAILTQTGISIYGGYFGGGIGFLMLAALTLAGMQIRKAGATKNILAGVMNASAVAVFAFSHDVAWNQVAIGVVCSIIGGQVGVQLLHKVNERYLRMAVICIGVTLTIFMFTQS